MGIFNIVLYLCCFIYSTTAVGQLYRSVTCLRELKVTSNLVASSLINCAILCHLHNKEVFSFNNQTGECEVFIEDIDAWPSCKTQSDGGYYKLQGGCHSVPVPLGYSLEYPYYGSSARARYRCTNITDQPPVDSCPITQCNAQHTLPSTPASCSVKDMFNNSLSEYEGGVTCTVRGVVCQRWDSYYPHRPSFYRGRSDLGNRCKLESEHRPWCYTTDPEIRWDFCPVVDMACGDPPSTSGSGTHTVWPYRGSFALAWYRCASFQTLEPMSSCPVTRCDGNLTWSNTSVSCSVKDCYDVINQTYHGRVFCTNTGNTCQRWDSDSPHRPDILRGRSDLQNWCQMAGKSRPWCYTTHPIVVWEYCAVEECP